MNSATGKMLERIGFALVFLMALLQGIYAIYAYLDPQAFSLLRGTQLFVTADSDWVKIYASRTLFVALIIGFLLFIREYQILAWASLFGTVMPISDAWLAYQAGVENIIVYKHLITLAYLLITFFVIRRIAGHRTKTQN